MTKKVSTIKHKCCECYWSIPDMSNLSTNTHEPILGSCKYQQYKILLNQTACDENFKKRND